MNNIEKNIFEGAKFGDKFMTRDGHIAVFDSHSKNGSCLYLLVQEEGIIEYASDGNRWLTDDYQEYELDIVSRYQEPITSKEIDEDKLDDIANNSLKKTQYYESTNEFEAVAYIDGYFDGYHKAFNI